MSRVLPDPGSAVSVIERYRDENGKLTSRKKKIVQLLASYSGFLGRAILRIPSIPEYLSDPEVIENGKAPADYVDELNKLISDASATEELNTKLRRYKYREFARIAYRDILGQCDFTETMQELSDLADAVMDSALNYHRAELDMDGAGQFVIIGMGKLGGGELNLSSDVDIIYLYRDEGDPDPFFKLAERVTKTLSAVTGEGFLYRVDLDLRPGGGKSTIAVPVEGALEHYYYWGDTWERAALIKARPSAGDIGLGEEFIREIEPFVYKKFLDYTSIEELKEMKTKLDSLHRVRDVKLGKGCIREVEFFVQALQLVHGGEFPEIRSNRTLSAIDKLEMAKIISPGVADTLSKAYVFLRRVEHYIQLAEERHTHQLPASREDMEKLAKSLGYQGKKEFEKVYEETTDSVTKVYRGLFYEPSQKTEEVGKEFWKVADFLMEGHIKQDEAVENLAKLGFKQPDVSLDVFSKLLDPQRGGLTKDARVTSRKVLPALLGRILKSSDPDAALSNLERFISSIGSRTSIYSIMLENPDIIELLARLFSTSGYLSNFLLRHPEYLDVITLRDVRTEFGSMEEMLAALREDIAEDEDYEDMLDTIRKFKHAETLKICLRDLNREVDPFYVGSYLSMVAEAVLRVGLDIAWEEMTGKKRMADKDRKMMVLGMGKLGGREMNYNSDLDVIFLYEGGDHEFYSRLGQRLISVMSIPTGEGAAYKIDMDLRPSGRAGALVTSYDSFRKYHETRSQTWERQALIRAKPSAGNARLGDKVMNYIDKIVYGTPPAPDFHKEIKHLRERMEKELANENAGKRNIKTGRGGIVDIEFLAQMLQLRHGGEYPELRTQNTAVALTALSETGLIKEREYETLYQGLRFFKGMENMLRLLHGRSINELYESDFEKLASELDMKTDGEGLKKEYIAKTESVRKIYDSYFS